MIADATSIVKSKRIHAFGLPLLAVDRGREGHPIFACRSCYELSYPSQREADYDRAARRADRIRERLGWKQAILNPKGWEKPKGMHWPAFERLNAKHDALVQKSLAGMAAQFNLLGESIDDWLYDDNW